MLRNGMKKCPRCGQKKAAAGSFYRVKREQGDGYAGYCIACAKKVAVAWQKDNPEKKRVSDKKQNAKPRRKAAAAARWEKWARENPEKAYARFKKYNQTERGRIKRNQYSALRRERMLRGTVSANGVTFSGLLTLQEWKQILEAFDYACAYCGAKAKLEFEHVQPLSRGGAHSRDNVVPACRKCNASKKGKTLDEYATSLGFDPEVYRRRVGLA